MKKLLFIISAAFVGVFLFNAIKSKPSYELQSPDSISIESSIVNCESHSPQYFQEKILKFMGDESLARKNKINVNELSKCLIEELDAFVPDFDVFSFIVGVALGKEITRENKIKKLQELGSSLSQNANEQQKKQIKSLIDYIEFFIIEPDSGGYTNQQAISVLEEIIQTNTLVENDVINQSFVCDVYRTLSIHYFLNNSGNDNHFKILDEGIAKSDKEYQYGIGCHAILSLMKAHLLIVSNVSQFGPLAFSSNSAYVRKMTPLLESFNRYEKHQQKKLHYLEA